jgi:hypothetical protein
MVKIPMFYKCKLVRLYSKTEKKLDDTKRTKKQKKSEEEQYDPQSSVFSVAKSHQILT